MVNYPAFPSRDKLPLVPGLLGRVQVSKNVVYKSDDSEDYHTVITQFKSESSRLQIDQDLRESDFKLQTLLDLGSEPQKMTLRSMSSSFDRVDLTLHNLSMFGNNEANFTAHVEESPIVEPSISSE